MSFQAQVNTQPAPAIEGDFASSNPRATMLAGAGALVTGALGAIVGRFAWATAAGVVSNAWSAASKVGFIHRSQQALITAFLGESGMVIPAGLYLTMFIAGDFWGRFAGGATIGQKVYAYYADGSLYSGVTATPPTNALITANTVVGTALTVTANTGLPIVVGQPVSGTAIPAGAYISALGTGTGGAGTYTLSAAATAIGTGITVTAQTAQETSYFVDSTAAAGELAKISTWG